jgi:6-phosphofructokinase 1
LSFGFIESFDRVLSIHLLSILRLPGSRKLLSFEMAGHMHLFFDPAKTKVAIITCGGLCPGLNNVIRGIVNELYYRYNVKRIIGIQYGYNGFITRYNHPAIDLTPQNVENIHLLEVPSSDRLAETRI